VTLKELTIREFYVKSIMIFTFISSNVLYTHVDVSPWHPMSVLGAIGAGLVAYTMYVLYMLQARKRILLTHGVFKYTRHPMYTGFFLMNLSAYLATEPDVWFYIQQCFFLHLSRLQDACKKSKQLCASAKRQSSTMR
jgi:protein-S-isoprenylcysteine O-methyltransferase Ste14